MFKKSLYKSPNKVAGVRDSERSEESRTPAAGDRSTAPRRSRRRPGARSSPVPYSQSEQPPEPTPPTRRSSSHRQGRSPVMDDLQSSFESFVGIDVAKENFEVFFMATNTGCTLPYDAAGIQTLVERLQALPRSLIVMEATGGLERRLATELITAGFVVAVVNPRLPYHFGLAHGQNAKTDR